MKNFRKCIVLLFFNILVPGQPFVPSRQFSAAVLLIFQYSVWANTQSFYISLKINSQKITKNKVGLAKEQSQRSPSPYISGIMLNTV